MRDLTEKEKEIMEDDDVGCMDPRAKEMMGRVMFVAVMIFLGIIAGIITAIIRWAV